MNIYCSSSTQKTQKINMNEQTQQIVGTLYVSGNEPFVKLHLAADNGKKYQLETDSLTLRQLWQLQGRHISISGKEQQTQLGIILYVKDYQKIQ